MKIPTDAIILTIYIPEHLPHTTRARVRYYVDGVYIEETLEGPDLDDAIDRAKAKALEDMPTDPRIH